MLHVFKIINVLKVLFAALIFLPVDYCDLDVNNAFIAEYFLFRAPATIVAFTCNEYNSK